MRCHTCIIFLIGKYRAFYNTQGYSWVRNLDNREDIDQDRINIFEIKCNRSMRKVSFVVIKKKRKKHKVKRH